MPLKNGELTRSERDFLAHYAEHHDREKAEKAAGLMPRTGYGILARPEIQSRLLAEVNARLLDMAPVAAVELRKMLTDAKIPAAVRFNAIKYALDKATGDAAGPAGKELHEMTPEELAAAIDSLSAQAATLAKPVDSGQVFD
jgi:hypothetical protein